MSEKLNPASFSAKLCFVAIALGLLISSTPERCLAQAKSGELPLVKIIATGGTIANTPEGRISGEDLVKAIPRLKDYARIEVEEFSRVNSTQFSTKMMLDLAKKVNSVLSTGDKPAGVVVTIGSNALEEAAYFLHLTVKSEKPVVFTAAQRRHGALGAEGDKNLLDAVRVAVWPEAAGKGVLAVTNEEIQSARDTTKTTSYRVDTWKSGDLGDLGLVDSDRISFYRNPTRRHTTRTEFDVASLDDLPKVYVIYSYVGADGVLVKAAVDQGKARGIVVAGFPSGAAARPVQDAALEKAVREGVVVVLSHRGGRGRLSRGAHSSTPNFVKADNLTPQKARILLMLALTRTTDRGEIQRMFDEY